MNTHAHSTQYSDTVCIGEIRSLRNNQVLYSCLNLLVDTPCAMKQQALLFLVTSFLILLTHGEEDPSPLLHQNRGLEAVAEAFRSLTPEQQAVLKSKLDPAWIKERLNLPPFLDGIVAAVIEAIFDNLEDSIEEVIDYVANKTEDVLDYAVDRIEKDIGELVQTLWERVRSYEINVCDVLQSMVHIV